MAERPCKFFNGSCVLTDLIFMSSRPKTIRSISSTPSKLSARQTVSNDTEDIPDSYVIFITENDVMGKNQAIYHIQRYVETNEGKELFGDGSHIIYVNGKYRGNDEVGKLMHDFSCTNPDDMNYEALAKRARYFKQDEKGVATMCKIMEDMRNEAAQKAELKNARETATRMIKKGKMSLGEIAEYIPLLSFEELKEIEAEVMQLA